MTDLVDLSAQQMRAEAACGTSHLRFINGVKFDLEAEVTIAGR